MKYDDVASNKFYARTIAAEYKSIELSILLTPDNL